MADTVTTRIAALEAALRATQAQLNAVSAIANAANSRPIPAAQTVQTKVYLATPVLVANGSAVVGWTTVSGNGVPSNAISVVLLGAFANSSGSVTPATFLVRATGMTTQYALAQTVSGAAFDTSSCPGYGEFPCKNGAFDWSTNSSRMQYTVYLIGYVSSGS